MLSSSIVFTYSVTNPSMAAMRFLTSIKCIQNTLPTHLPLRASIILQHRRSLYTRSFTSTTKRSDFHFDTHHFVQRLEREGLKREQAEGIMTAMAEVIDEAIRNMTSNMVTKSQQEKVCLLQQSNSSSFSQPTLTQISRFFPHFLWIKKSINTPNKSTLPNPNPNFNSWPKTILP